MRCRAADPSLPERHAAEIAGLVTGRRSWSWLVPCQHACLPPSPCLPSPSPCPLPPSFLPPPPCLPPACPLPACPPACLPPACLALVESRRRGAGGWVGAGGGAGRRS